MSYRVFENFLRVAAKKISGQFIAEHPSAPVVSLGTYVCDFSVRGERKALLRTVFRFASGGDQSPNTLG